MDAVTYARKQLESTFGLFNMCADGMSDEQYNFNPGGTCNTAAKSHVHAMTSIDFFVNGMLRGAGLGWTAVANANGLPANPMEIWGFDGTIPLDAIKQYGAEVQRQALDYVASLKPEDLDRELDTRFFGKQTVAFVLQLAVNHSMGHGGDIAAVKGMQGLKGLPF